MTPGPADALGRLDGEPWCEDFTAHASSHEFCGDHQLAWCRRCDDGVCPECVNDPHCPECHCSIYDENHEWDCSYAD